MPEYEVRILKQGCACPCSCSTSLTQFLLRCLVMCVEESFISTKLTSDPFAVWMLFRSHSMCIYIVTIGNGHGQMNESHRFLFACMCNYRYTYITLTVC